MTAETMIPLDNPSGCQAFAPRRAPWWRRVRNRSPLLRYLFPPDVWSGVVVEAENGIRACILYEHMGMVNYQLIDELGRPRHAVDRRYFASVFRKV